MDAFLDRTRKGTQETLLSRNFGKTVNACILISTGETIAAPQRLNKNRA